MHNRIILVPQYDTTPRVRGLLDKQKIYSTEDRYNPACAGTTKMLDEEVDMPEIQPRVCGDYPRMRLNTLKTRDTTPRVRGLR